MSILVFVLLQKIDLNFVVIITVIALNVSSLVLLSIHIKKNNSQNTSLVIKEQQSFDESYLDFRKQAINKCGDELGEALCEIANAFKEIKILFDASFIKGISDTEFTESIIYPGGLKDSGKLTTHLESKIETIYKKMITGSKNHKGVLSTDINMQTGNSSSGNYRWIVDGLDGGLHFLRNISIFSSSIALQKKEGRNWSTIIGAVLIPTTNEFFFAIKDKGAFLNNWETKLPLNNRPDKLNECIFYIESPTINTINNEGQDKYEDCYTLIKSLNSKNKKNRNFNVGSYGLAYLAKGSWDAYISLAGTTSMYDSEAGKLLVEESGKDDDKPTMYVIKEPVREEDGIDMGSRIFSSSEKILKILIKDDVLYSDIKKIFPNFKSKLKC